MKPLFFSITIVLGIVLITGCVQSEEPEYQDAQWNTSFHNNLALIHSNLNATKSATDMTNSFTDPSYERAAHNFISDAKAGISENNNFTVSPEMQEAQKEYGLGLNDTIALGECLLNLTAAQKDNNITRTNEELRNMGAIGSSMASHMDRANTLSKIALGT